MANGFRLHLTYLRDSDIAPATAIAKLSSTDAASRQMAVGHAYQREVVFYRRTSIESRTRNLIAFEIGAEGAGDPGKCAVTSGIRRSEPPLDAGVVDA
jgi:hypothetical protein